MLEARPLFRGGERGREGALMLERLTCFKRQYEPRYTQCSTGTKVGNIDIYQEWGIELFKESGLPGMDMYLIFRYLIHSMETNTPLAYPGELGKVACAEKYRAAYYLLVTSRLFSSTTTAYIGRLTH